jgi:hypothetical protein
MSNQLGTRAKRKEIGHLYAEFRFAQYSATLNTLTQHLPIEGSRIVASNVTLEELFGH